MTIMIINPRHLLAATLLFHSASNAEIALSTPRKVDVGDLRVGELGNLSFSIRNDSDREIEIARITPSCTCTDVKLVGDTTLTPGAERTITGNVSLSGTPGFYETKIGIVFGAGDEQYETTVPVRGQLVVALALEKPHIDFGEIDLNAGLQTISIGAKRGNSGEKWSSIQPVVRNEHLSVTVEEVSNTLSQLVVRFTPSGLPISTFRSIIKLRLIGQDGEALPGEIEIPVNARIKGPLRASPASIYLGVITPNTAFERSVVISSNGLDVRGLAIGENPKNGTADITYTRDGKARLTVRITPAIDKAFNDGLTLVHSSTGIRLAIPIIGALKTVNLHDD